MIKLNDLICIPFTPDLTEGGITIACRSLPHVYNHQTGSSIDRLRRTIVGIAVELAFRRYLTKQNIPFDVKRAEPFTDPDHYDVTLGGRRCDLKSFLISSCSQISSLKANPELALTTPALVPLDQYTADGQSDNDIYLFVFLTGRIAASPGDILNAANRTQPVYLIHTMPMTWNRPTSWIPLGPLILKSDSDETVNLVIGGQDAEREFLTHSLELPPRKRIEMDGNFYSLAYLHAKVKPCGRVGIFSPSRKETYLIEKGQWSNIWIYGLDIYLTGWISRAEFRQRASLIKEGSRVFQMNHPYEKSLAVSVSDLRPLSDLFERVRTWQRSV